MSAREKLEAIAAEQDPYEQLVDRYVRDMLARREAERRVDEILHPSTFTVRTRDDIAHLQPPEPLLRGFLYTSTVGVLGSPGGVGKTATALGAACALAAPGFDTWLGMDVANTRTLYIAGEGAPSLDRRIRSWEAHNGVDAGSVNIDFVTTAMLTPSNLDALTDTVGEHQYGFVVADTAATLARIRNENDNGEVSDFIGRFRRAVHAGNPTACGLICHHVTSQTDRHGRKSQKLRGASAWRDDCDTVALLEGTKDDFTLSTDESHAGKQKDSAPMTLAGLYLRHVEKHITVAVMGERERRERYAHIRRLVELMVPGAAYSSTELRGKWSMETNQSGYQDARTKAIEAGWIVKGEGHKGKYTRTLDNDE